MLHELDMNVIVEGVEEQAQRDFLLACGCNNAQGYLFYKPMPAENFVALLDAGAEIMMGEQERG